MSKQDRVEITAVRVSNVKGIKYVEIKPRPGTTLIGGRNGSGKTTICEAIGMTAGSRKLMPKMPIRRGEKFAFTEIELSECHIAGLMSPCVARAEFTLRDNGTIKRELTITNNEGNLAGSPQDIMDGLISSVGFDPLSFLKERPEKQLEIVKAIVGVDFDQLDAQRKRLYDQRTKVNSKADESKTRCSAIHVLGGVPDVEVSVASLMKDLKSAADFNKECDLKKTDHQLLVNKLGKATSAVADVTKQIEELIARRTKLIQDEDGLKAQVGTSQYNVDSLVYADTEEVSKQITDSQKVNEQIRKKQEKNRLNTEYETQDTVSKKLTEDIKQIDATKEKIISEAKWPITGMSFSEEFGLAYNGIPLDQLSQAEGIQVSISIGAALNPVMPYMFIKDGSLLDNEHKIEAATIAAKYGCQLFMEIVGEDDSCDVVIKDGEVDSISDDCVLPPKEVNASEDAEAEGLFK